MRLPQRLSKRQVEELVGLPRALRPDEALAARYPARGCDVFRLPDGRIVVDLFGSGGQEFRDENEFDTFLQDVVKVPELRFPNTFGVPPEEALARVERMSADALPGDDAGWERLWRAAHRAERRGDEARCLRTAGILGESVRRSVGGRWTLAGGIPTVEDREGRLYHVFGALAKALVERGATLIVLRDALPMSPREPPRPRHRYVFEDGEIRLLVE